MSTPPVYWHQGMFLRPHHFQASDRYWTEQQRINSRFDAHHNWGIKAVKIDFDALKNHLFVVDRIAARLRDGTIVIAERGTDRALDPLPLKDAVAHLEPGQTFDVLLAVPTLQIGRPNTGQKPDPATRFHADPARQPVEDENDGKTPSLVDLRRLNVQLLTSDKSTTGYETIPIARLERSTKATGEPRLHEAYIPPLLSCDDWDPLATGIIAQIFNRIGGMVKQLGRQVKDQGIRFDNNNPEQRKVFEQLRALNEGYAAFGVVAQAGGVHPFPAYLELARLAGKLAVFGKNATLPEDLPPYDHDDLGRCFFAVKRMLDDLLTGGIVQGYEMRPFVGEGSKLGVTIDPAWLVPACQLLVGVESNLPTVDVERYMRGRLNMKIGTTQRVDTIFERGEKGLDFTHDHKPPPVLPASSASADRSLTYFRIGRDSAATGSMRPGETRKSEWQLLTETCNLAVRFNLANLVGEVNGRRDVNLQIDGKAVALRFTLYIVLPSVQGE